MLLYHGISDPGCVRSNNEDQILMDSNLGLFVVADGMGGHRYGQVAAEVAISTLRHYLESSRSPEDVTWPFGYNWQLSLDANRLTTGILLANRHVWRRAEEAPEYAGMGSTLVAALIDGKQAVIANVGDSRAYLFRTGALSQLTVDDTWVASIVQGGMLDKAALLKHPMRNVLTQAAGTENDLDVHIREVEFVVQDALLLCSDGLYGVVSEECIASVLSSSQSIEQQVARLQEAARAEGAPDNFSCVLLRHQTEGPGRQ